MTAWEKAAKWHEQYIPDTNFAVAVAENFRRPNGFVYSVGPTFIMGQEVYWDEEHKVAIEDKEPNAWFVELAAMLGGGEPFLRFMQVAPYPHRWVLWQRRNDGRLRARLWHDLITKLQGKD